MKITGSYTDQYQLTMAQAYFLRGNSDEPAIYDYFFRKLPFKGGYAIFAGLETLLQVLENLEFTFEDLEFLQKEGFDKGFINHLKDFRFRGSVYSTLEGDTVFPTRPVLTIEAGIIEAQIIETLILNILNFQTLIATKASRIRLVAPNQQLIDFGMRRAQGMASGYASRAAMIGGFNGTSNVQAGKDYDIPVSGTMAHSYIQSFNSELEAFRHYAGVWPDNCIFLVDTYNTLNSGLPNAIKVAHEMEKQGKRLKGIRLDSGDLAYLAKKSRDMLDKAGLGYVKIAVSNQLDEYVIKSLLEQGAPIDLFGVGTSLITGQPDAALDGVYKLAASGGKPRIKLSDNPVKSTIPYHKQVYRLHNSDDCITGADVIGLPDEINFSTIYHPFNPTKFTKFENCKGEALLHQVMLNGKRTTAAKSIDQSAKYAQQRLSELPAEYRRFINPHIYKVGLSPLLREKRNKLIEEIKKEY